MIIKNNHNLIKKILTTFVIVFSLFAYTKVVSAIGTKSVYSGTPVTITWNVGNAEGCTPTTNYPSTGDGVRSTWITGNNIPAGSLALGAPTSIGTWTFTCTSYNPTGASDTATLEVLDGSCALPWGGTLADGDSVTAYQSSSVISPATCVSETRSCFHGVLSGSYTHSNCNVGTRSGSLTAPTQCEISAGNSTCTVPLTWTSTNFTSPKVIDNNTGNELSTLANKSSPGLTAYVAYGGTTFKLKDGSTTFDTKTTNGVCATGTSWNGSICVITKSGSISGPSSCLITSGNSTCTVPLTWTSANFTDPKLTDENMSTTLSTNANQSSPGMTVWVAYGGTTFKLKDGSDTFDTKTVSGICDTNLSWNGTVCSAPSIPPCVAGEQSCCPSGQVWNGTSCSTTSCSIGSQSCCPSGQVWNGTSCVTQTPTPSVTSATVTPVCNGTTTSNATLSVQCSSSTGFRVENSSDQIISNSSSPSGDVSLNQTGTYGIVCVNGSTSGTKVYRTFSSSLCGTQIISFTASPTTISSGALSTLTWKIEGTPNSCTLSASPVCANGSCSQSATDDASSLNSTLTNGNTDANDPAGSRPIPSTLQNNASGSSYATGKKTLKINRTTDFLIDCGSGVSKKVRVQVTNLNEG